MRFAQTHYDNSETGCCARLDAARWDDREFVWRDKLFLKDHIRSFLHIPLNFGSVISRDNAAVEDAEAYPEEPLWLTDEVSPWGADLLMAVDREVPGAEMERISGTFVARVFDGPYRNLGKWTSSIEQSAAAEGHHVSKIYYYYATCPKCAKRFGKNQVVLFAQVA